MMNCAGKLKRLKTLLGIEASDTSRDEQLTAYLDTAREEIINWRYVNYADVPPDAEVPLKYGIVHVDAVVAGYNLQGGENEFKHVENGITREFNYASMVDYIHAHVKQLVKT